MSEQYDIKSEPYEGTEPYIFVSYKRDDLSVVYPVVERLYAEGFRIWIDSAIKLSDERFRSTLSEKIRGCSLFLAFYSNKYQLSPECGKEVICFLENHLGEKIGKAIIMIGSYKDIDTSAQSCLMEYFLEGANGFEYEGESDLDRLVRLYKNDPEIGKCCDPSRVPLRYRLISKRKDIIKRYYRTFDEDSQMNLTFDDNVIDDLCSAMPKNREEFLAVRYLGEKKYEKFGEEVIAVIKQYIADTESLDSGESCAPYKTAKDRAAIPADSTDSYKMKKSSVSDKPLTDSQKKLAESFRKSPYIKAIAEDMKLSFTEVVQELLKLSVREDCADICEKFAEIAKENAAVKGVLLKLKDKENKELIARSGVLKNSRKGTE